MAENQDQINAMLVRLEEMLKQQEAFSREILAMKGELLKQKTAGQSTQKNEAEFAAPQIIPQPPAQPAPITPKPQQQMAAAPQPQQPRIPKPKSDIEKFIGENLINKIGILITVLGVVFGAKYSIEHDLVSPLTRIVLGLLVGLGLLGFGMKLKAKYESFSAVLVSGAMASLYFVTFAAHMLYQLIPQTVAFAFMVVYTAFTVFAALKYDRKVIALIGLIGAYAVPFLLSDGSGKIVVLFSYMAIINIGILVIAFKKNWKVLYYSAFACTWIIVLGWLIASYNQSHFAIALSFSAIFFLTFYLTFLAYKLLHNEPFKRRDVVMVLLNSFTFYSVGYFVLSYIDETSNLVGLFTLVNAVVHFIVAVAVYKRKLADNNILHLIAGLVLVFITLTIPVQLNGNWVTLIWISEAVLLFWIGRTKNVGFYEKLSYPLIAFAGFSLLHDWAEQNYQAFQESFTPIFNIGFLSSILFSLMVLFVVFIQRKPEFKSAFDETKLLSKFLKLAIPVLFLSTLYFSFQNEIGTYFIHAYEQSAVTISGDEYSEMSSTTYNQDLFTFKRIWEINFTLLFFSILAFVNLKRIKNEILGWASTGFLAFSIFLFLSTSLFEISELRESYVDQLLSEYFDIGTLHLTIRYISLAFAAVALIVLRKCIKQPTFKGKLDIPFELFSHIVIVWIASSELIGWMHLSGFTQTYKLALSILWGLYAVMLIALGIWKKKQYLRIAAIALFGVTLIKLFFYDISHLDTISKTVVFVSLGVLLLIISFLYNKFKHIINEPEK
ncbi:MAG: DUF2339 domain-containing protein [Cryomorphaceae bacterium]|nr:DUF2339 domain-containing protein [Cryomorphaceae bacterium]